VVSPRLAELVGGVGGLLPVQIGGSIVPLRVAGVIDRFPSSEDEVVVGDRMALRTAINAVAPGAARENELWLDVAPDRRAEVAARLTRSPFRALTTVSRADLEADARRDPLAHGTLIALAAAALVALVLAAIGLALAVRSDVRDDRGELYDLEAQGASPSLLRRVVRFRALVLSVVGLLAGGLVGLALLGLVTRVVSVTARGNVAEPPLVAAVDPLVILVAVAGYGLLAALLVGTTTRRSFAGSRGPELRSVD
jgi:predicted lysophospholipase L1 biosynthesis ABC-type transport system permease subunit